MGFRDYVYSFLLFVLLVTVIFSMDQRQAERIEVIRDEITDIRWTMKANQESLMVNVKKPVWWR